MNIAFTINQLGVEGLGATLSSMLHHCSDSAQLDLYFLCNKLDKQHKENIQTLLQSKNFEGSYQFINFDAKKEFGHLHSLHGDWTAYGKLLIPELIGTEKILSLDSDLLILLDILELNNFQQEDYAVVAYNTGEAQHTRDSFFYYNRLQLPLRTPICNTGIMLFNSSIWKAQKVTQRYQKLGEKYAPHLLCADQTLLNATLGGEFGHLPYKYNFRWFPDLANDNQQSVIFHFVGSPKPWDILGKQIHPAYDSWLHYQPNLWTTKYSAVTYQKICRTWKIRKSIARCLISQFKSGINASTNYYPSNL